MKNLIVPIIYLISGLTYANECKLPNIADMDKNYDWLRESDSNECLKEVINQPADYYMLAISHSPTFCAAKEDRKLTHKFQCGGDNKFTWVVHGLWAESKDPKKCFTGAGKVVMQHPRYCGGDAIGPLQIDLIAKYMCMQPGEKLIQSQWEKHGTCGDFNSAEEYLKKENELFASLQLPPEISSETDLIGEIKKSNPNLKQYKILLDKKANSISICYSKSWEYVDCK